MSEPHADAEFGNNYALALSDDEFLRYRALAQEAVDFERAEWVAAGIQEGASVAEIGCGPGAILKYLAEMVGPAGAVVGIDADPQAVALATQELEGLAQTEVRVGTALETGLEPESFDVVMCRHVLAHNLRADEAPIVEHLASLVKPGGSLYLVDVDFEAFRHCHQDPVLDDMEDKYIAFQRARGCDLMVGLRLGELLADAGLHVERYLCGGLVQRQPDGSRLPPWAARRAMVAEGFATEADVAHWDEAFIRRESSDQAMLLFPLGKCIAVGRRS
jgi:SAM-dependent methyltransferase